MWPSCSLIRRISAAVVLIIMFHGAAAVVRANAPMVPPQMYRPLLFDQSDPIAFPVVIAHNPGDQAASTRRALAYRAPIIEIDVVLYQDALYAAHDVPHSWFARLVWRLTPPPPLAHAWKSAAHADAVQLDFKSSASEMIPLLLDVLNGQTPEIRFVVSSRNRELLSTIRSTLQEAQTVLSIGDSEALLNAVSSPPVEGLSGVSVRASLLTLDVVDSFHEIGLFVIAWTVDDQISLDSFRRLPVDAISSNNLAIIERSAAIAPGFTGDESSREFGRGAEVINLFRSINTELLDYSKRGRGGTATV